MAICRDCGNYGFPDRKCETCGYERNKLNLQTMEAQELTEFVDKLDRLDIPSEYQGNEWSTTTFWRNNSHRKNELLEKFIGKLEQLHTIFASGKLPARGCIIIAPSTYSKITWAFSCMSHAIKAGYTVAPLLDTLEANRFILKSVKDLNYKLYGKMDIDEYIMSDLLFLTVTKTTERRSAFSVIREITSRRSRKGLLTFVLSEFGLEELSYWDKTGAFVRTNTEIFFNEDRKKIPAIISYREGGFKGE